MAHKPDDVSPLAAFGRVRDSGERDLRAVEPTSDERDLAARLAEVLEGDRLDVAYQPIVALAEGRTTGFEVLARWTDPVLGAVPPCRFVPVAERCGLIELLGRQVLDRATAQLARWRALPGCDGLTLSVNVSAHQLEVPGFPDAVAGALARTGLPAAALVLELTETTWIPPQAMATVAALADAGVTLALDDFGTGFSSPTRLGVLPVDEVKLDRRFVATRDGRLTPIARALVAAGDAAGLAVVAEGIETEAQRRQLLDCGCRLGQGFLLGRPAPAEQQTRALRAGAAAAPA